MAQVSSGWSMVRRTGVAVVFADALTGRWPEQHESTGFYWRGDGAIPQRTMGN